MIAVKYTLLHISVVNISLNCVALLDWLSQFLNDYLEFEITIWWLGN